jgi:hypothetical protein
MIGSTKMFPDGRKVAVYDYDDRHKMVQFIDKNGFTQEQLYEVDVLKELAKLIVTRVTPPVD